MKAKMTEKAMSERRRIQRQKFSFYMLVVDDDTQARLGHLVEVSQKGMQLETPAPLPVGKVYHLRMELTPDISNNLFMFITAITKWCKPDTITPNLYHNGFEITEMGPEDHEIYQRLVGKYGGQ
jgi:hypothetical protein